MAMGPGGAVDLSGAESELSEHMRRGAVTAVTNNFFKGRIDDNFQVTFFA